MTKNSNKTWPTWNQFWGWSIPAKASFAGVPLAIILTIIGWLFFSNKAINQTGTTNIQIGENRGTVNISFKSNEKRPRR